MTRISTRTAATVAALALASALVGFAPSADAAAISHSSGQFLTGEAGGTPFSTVAALNGETATAPGDPGPNQNDLSGSLLGQSIAGPTKNISVPFPGGVTFGAVGQYAQAATDGSAQASSGLIGSNGAINVGGSGNDDVATIDLSNLPNASSLTDVLGNLVLHVGAVSAQAKQAAFGKKLSDPSAGCSSGNYLRVSDSDQAGSYQFANLSLTATSAGLMQLGTVLKTNLGTVLDQLSTAASALPGGLVSVSGLPTSSQIADKLTLNLPGITASLVDGTLTIDLAKILKAAGVDINNLCPNTDLLPYLARALGKIPQALSDLFTNLTDSFSGVVITIAGTPLSADALKAFTDPFKAALVSNFQTVFDQFSTALDPALAAITQNLLDVVVNAQDESGGTFTETAVQLDLIPGGGSLPTIPGIPTLPGIPTNALRQAAQNGTAGAAARMKHGSSGGSTSGGSSSGGSSSGGSSGGSSSGSSGPSLPGGITVPGVSAGIAGVHDFGPIAVAASASNPVLQLNLASASVTNAAPAGTTPTSAAPTSPAVASGTALPTGVPAGAAGHGGGSPMTPLVVVLLGLIVAAGGWASYRWRVQRGH